MHEGLALSFCMYDFTCLCMHAYVCVLKRASVWVTGCKLWSDSASSGMKWNWSSAPASWFTISNTLYTPSVHVTSHVCFRAIVCMRLCFVCVTMCSSTCACCSPPLGFIGMYVSDVSLSSRAVTYENIYLRIAFVCLRGAVPFENPTVKYWIGWHTEIEPRRIISLGLEDQIFFFLLWGRNAAWREIFLLCFSF